MGMTSPSTLEAWRAQARDYAAWEAQREVSARDRWLSADDSWPHPVPAGVAELNDARKWWLAHMPGITPPASEAELLATYRQWQAWPSTLRS